MIDGSADTALENKEKTVGGQTGPSVAEDAFNVSANAPVPPIPPVPPISDAPSLVPAPGASTVTIKITLFIGGLSHVDAPVVIVGRYEGLALVGAPKAFDAPLDSWLTHALDMGMIGSGLGQLFPVDLQEPHKAGKVKAQHLLLVGMGEPGRFTGDDVQFLMSNLTVAVDHLGYDQFATGLFGTRRNEVPVGEAVRAFILGIRAGYKRIQDIRVVARDEQERFRRADSASLHVMLVVPRESGLTDANERVKDIKAALESLRGELAAEAPRELDGELAAEAPRVKLDVVESAEELAPDTLTDSGGIDGKPEVPATFLRVTRKMSALSATSTVQPPAISELGRTETFEFSALSENSTVAVREDDVNAYLIKKLTDRMVTPHEETHEELGLFFTNLVIPEDFRTLTENAANLIFEVDETTAMYPWEMMAREKHGSTSFLGTKAAVSRQFRSLLAPSPGSPPPLNRSLRALVIADPTSDQWRLPSARREALSVVSALDKARRQGQYKISVAVRIGAGTDPEPEPELEELKQQSEWILSAKPCDPLEIAIQVINGRYDLIHYAGHGFFDAKTGRAGWVLDKECSLSAREIFRARQVPRLVFANACFSAAIPGNTERAIGRREERERLVGVAQAFLARGIPNFIGTGWKVEDASAAECAALFYEWVLGLRGSSGPATISRSLMEARQEARQQAHKQSSSWGAYQHYGRVSDRLIAAP